MSAAVLARHSESGRLTPPSSFVPTDYDELFREYWDYVCALVAKHGVRDEEGAASEILVKFYERDFLAKFRVGAEFDTPNGRKRSNFRGFLTGFVGLYVRQCKDREMTRANKEPVRLEQPVGEGQTWVDTHQPVLTDENEFIDFNMRAKAALAHLRSLPIRGTRDLARIFEMLVEQVNTDGRSNRKEIAKEFHVSDTAICLMFADLREELREFGFAPGLV